MNKLFSKIASLSVGLAMAAGVGLALGQQRVERVSAAEVTATRSADSPLSTTAEAIDGDSNVTIKTSAANTYKDPCRFYANTTITIEALNGAKLTKVVYNASSTGNYVTYAQNATVSPSVTPTVNSKAVTWDLSSSKPETFTITVSTQTRWDSIAVTYEESTGPAVSITNAPDSNLSIGDSGTFTASSLRATNPSYTWSSDNDAVLTVSAAGAYEAKAYGVANVTVNMTCDEGNASKSAKIVVDAGVITIAEAITICDGLSSGQTTPYKVSLEGYITNLDADNKGAGNERALKISTAKVDGSGTEFQIYGVYNNYAERTYIILNGFVRYRGNLTVYNTNKQLASPQIVSYTDDAETYAKAAYESLNEACATGPSAVTNEQWTALTNDFDALDEYAQAKLAGASASYPREDVANWIDRYARIVNAGRDNFMGNTEISVLYNPGLTQQNIGYVIVISIVAVSAISFGLFFMLRKRKEK